MSNIPVADEPVWLSLMCKLHLQHNIVFTPSPEEISIMINSQELWADTAVYEPDRVEYLVVSDSTLVWTSKNRGPHLKTWCETPNFVYKAVPKRRIL